MCICFQCEQVLDEDSLRLMDVENINVYYFCSEECQEKFIEEQNENYDGITPLIFRSS